ncbi:uncharacterized protein LOC143898824 isoform X2 [Temnothorax americanus]
MDPSQDRSEWWKNLDLSDSDHAAPTSPRRNLSAAIVKTNILQTSTSESEKELELKKRKVHLRATNNRKSTNNAFSSALSDTEVTVPLKLRKKRANYSELHSDSDREVSRERLREDEEDDNLSPTEEILKSKPRISRRRKDDGTKDQNPFRDILTEDGALNGSTTRQSVALEKESSKRLMHRSIDESKEHADDQRKSVRASQASQAIPLKSVETDSLNLLSPNVENAALQQITQRNSTSTEAIVKTNILQTSTSESEKELELKKRKAHLRATNNRKSTNNAFSSALSDTEVTVPLKLRKKRANYSELHSDSDRGVSRERLREDEEDDNLSPTEEILKSKPRISRRRKDDGTKDQNPFRDILTEDGALNGSTTRQSVALEKESSKRLMHRSIDESKEHADDQRKSVRASQASQAIPLKSVETDSLNLLSPNVENAALQQITQRNSTSTEAIVKTNILQTSTSESEKELELKKRKAHLRATNNRKSTNNAFSSALNDTEVTVPLKLRKKRANYSELHSDSDRGVSRERLREDEEDDNLSPTEEILKSKPRISRRRKDDGTKDQNPFRDILTEDGALNGSTTRQSVALEKESSKRLMHRSIDASKEHADDQRKSVRASQASQAIPLKSVETDSLNLLSPNVENAALQQITQRNSTSTEAIVKTNTLQTSTSESEKELELKKRKVHLRATNNRKSTNNAFSSTLNDTEVTVPLKLRKNRANYSELHSDSDRGVSRERLREDEEDDNLSPTEEILKSKPRISRRRKDDGTKVQNPFRDILTEDGALNGSTTRQSVALEKESSKRLMHRSIDASKEHADDQRKSVRASQAIPLKSVETDSLNLLSPNVENAALQQITQRNSTSTEAETGSKAVNRQSAQSSNRTSIKESRETAGRQTSLNESQNYRNTSVRASSKAVSFNASKLNSSKILRKIDDFFKVKQASTTIDKSIERARKSQTFDTEKMEKIKTELERIKQREIAAMKKVTNDKKESALKTKDVKSLTSKQATKKKPVANFTKVVNKAFLVDGKVYRAPRLPRPKHWATDRLYKFLWNRMEPKYKLATRLKSEKFVQELAKIVSLVERRKNYENYKIEMQALMKQMARLGIISTRNDFYHFCQDFLPYEFRVKVVPMLLPGNKINIPYDPEKLHIPLLDT